MQLIKTQNPSLAVLAGAMLVCWWALAAEFASGLRCITQELWQQYLAERRTVRAFDATHPVSTVPVLAHTFDDLEVLDESALQTVAREIGQPAWLWAAVLALIAAVALIDTLGGWPLLFDACGQALARVARS